MLQREKMEILMEQAEEIIAIPTIKDLTLDDIIMTLSQSM